MFQNPVCSALYGLCFSGTPVTVPEHNMSDHVCQMRDRMGAPYEVLCRVDLRIVR
jgi:hypothetical protein